MAQLTGQCLPLDGLQRLAHVGEALPDTTDVEAMFQEFGAEIALHPSPVHANLRDVVLLADVEDFVEDVFLIRYVARCRAEVGGVKVVRAGPQTLDALWRDKRQIIR